MTGLQSKSHDPVIKPSHLSLKYFNLILPPDSIFPDVVFPSGFPNQNFVGIPPYLWGPL